MTERDQNPSSLLVLKQIESIYGARGSASCSAIRQALDEENSGLFFFSFFPLHPIMSTLTTDKETTSKFESIPEDIIPHIVEEINGWAEIEISGKRWREEKEEARR